MLTTKEKRSEIKISLRYFFKRKIYYFKFSLSNAAIQYAARAMQLISVACDSKSPFIKGGFRGNVNTFAYELPKQLYYFKFALSNAATRYAARAMQLICKSSCA